MRIVSQMLQRCIPIPQRYLLSIIAFIALMLTYNMRVCLNLAMTEMVAHKAVTGLSNYTNKQETCPDIEPEANLFDTEDKPEADGTFDWSEKTQGLIFSSFSWGYVITQVPGGFLSDKFGGKYVFGFGVLLPAVSTLLLPSFAEMGSWWLLALRFFTGLAEGGLFPSATSLISKWVPLEERAFLATLAYAGTRIGVITGNLITGFLLHTFNGQWPIVFYFFGTAGVLWAVIIFFFCYSTPDEHPFITKKEKLFLKERIAEKEKLPCTPWVRILTSLPVLALICGNIGHDWGLNLMLNDLPKYMKEVLKFQIREVGVFTSLPYLVLWLASMFSSWICDKLISNKLVTITAARRLFTAITLVGMSVGVIGASYSGCEKTNVIISFCVGMGSLGCFYPGLKLNALDLSPNYSGTVMAVTNAIGSVTGIITPYLVGVLATNHTLTEWRLLFWITVVINIVTLIIFFAFGSGEIQPWNEVHATAVTKTEGSERNEENYAVSVQSTL